MDSRFSSGRPAGPVPTDGSPEAPRAWRISARPRGTLPTWWAVGAAVLIVALLTAGLHLLFR